MSSIEYSINKSNNTATFHIDLNEFTRMPNLSLYPNIIDQKIAEIIATEYIKKHKKELMKSITTAGLHQAVTEEIAKIIVGDFVYRLRSKND